MEEKNTVCTVVINEEGKVLLVSRKDNDGDFGFPGGKLEPGETLLEAAARELLEETGIIADPGQVLQIHKGPARTSMCTTFFIMNWSGVAEQKGEGVVKWGEFHEAIFNPDGNPTTFSNYNIKLLNTMMSQYGFRTSTILGKIPKHPINW